MRDKQARGELVRSIGSGDLPAFLLDGRAQAGILYVSEARQLDADLMRTIELPADEDMHEHVRFVVAALTEHGTPFVRWLLQPDARAALDAAGFSR